MRHKFFGWRPLVVVAAVTASVFAIGASVGGAADPIQSPAGCNADNSTVNIARSNITAVVGQTITFTVSSGNPTSVDGCDITGRTLKLTLPDGSSQVFGPFNEPNGTAVTVRGSGNYVANAADLFAGKWTGTVEWTGTQQDGFDSNSKGAKETSVSQLVPGTTLSIVGTPPQKVHAGASVTITVHELNSGQTPLTSVNVTGTPCANWAPVGAFSGNLAIGASQDFSCTFTAGAAGTNTTWTADGHGLDPALNAAPTTNEHQEGSIHSINPATTLVVKAPAPPANVHAGASVHLVVTETNTGDDTLTGVNVTGAPAVGCATLTAVGAFGGTLAPGASQDFECTFTAGAGNTAWSADGHGTDSLGSPAPTAGEHVQGSVHAINPATSLVVKAPAPPANVHAGASVHLVVTETNTGDDTLTGVNVTGAPAAGCATLTPVGVFAGTLAPGASQDFECTFTAAAAGGNTAWSADGHGTDSLGTPAPTAGEHVQGSVHSINPATSLTLVGTPPTVVTKGAQATVTVKETNTGDDTLTGVNVTGAAAGCAVWAAVGVFNGTLAPGASQDFTCTFTVNATVAWTADGHGTDSLGMAAPSANEHQEGTVVPESVTIVKKTNGADANNPNGAGVPVIKPGDPVTWTYEVTNTGSSHIPKASVVVTDNVTGVTPAYDSEITGNGDATFDPGEVWLFKATGTAINVNTPPAGTHVVQGVCTQGGTSAPSAAYTNIGTVTTPAGTATDPSSYCNPPKIAIVKFTNGADANDPNAAGVPDISPNGVVTWTYRVTNTGATHVPKANVVVTDNVTGVTPTYTSEITGNGDAIFDPGEVWLFTATGTALDLTLTPPAGTHLVNGVCTQGNTRPAATGYTNIGTATIPGASATDPSSYCNPPGSKGLITETNVACGDVLSGNALNFLINQINYSGRLAIGQGINPGKFFFWSKITTTVPNQVVTVTQTNNSTNSAASFPIHQGWARIYTGDCNGYQTGTEIGGGSGASFTVPTPGTYFIGIKYDPKGIAGTKIPVPATVKYTFTTSLGGTTGASVLLGPG